MEFDIGFMHKADKNELRWLNFYITRETRQ